jgi:hypothetical protein
MATPIKCIIIRSFIDISSITINISRLLGDIRVPIYEW